VTLGKGNADEGKDGVSTISCCADVGVKVCEKKRATRDSVAASGKSKEVEKTGQMGKKFAL